MIVLKSIRYGYSILVHKWYVLHYGLKVGKIPLWQLLIHDLSKFTPGEFGPYRRRYFGGLVPTPEWKAAFRRHYARNPHHWECWVQDGVPTPMPERYVREMIADWQAASQTYGEPIQKWFWRKHSQMNLHPETIKILNPLIISLGLRFPESKAAL